MSNEIAQDSPESRDSKPTKRNATERQREAGRENLKRFNQSRRGKPNLKHGIGTAVRAGEVPPSIPGAEKIEKQLDELEEGLGTANAGSR